MAGFDYAYDYDPEVSRAKIVSGPEPPRAQPIPGVAHGSITGLGGIDAPGLMNTAGAYARAGSPVDKSMVPPPTVPSVNVPRRESATGDIPGGGEHAAVGYAGRAISGQDAEAGKKNPAAPSQETPPQGLYNSASAPVPGARPSMANSVPEGSLLHRVFSGNFHAPNSLSYTLMALGAGMAGAPSLGTGLGRGFTNAIPAMRMDIAQDQQNQTAAVLQRAGMSPDVARIVSFNPQLTQAAIGQMQGITPPHTLMVPGPLGSTPLQYNPSTRNWEPLHGAGGAGGVGPGALPANVSADQWSAMTSDQRLAAAMKDNPTLAAIAQTVHEGGAAPPGRLPAAMGIAKLIWPDFTENDYNLAKTTASKLANLSPNATGGILTNGFSAFDHLGHFSDGMVGVKEAGGGSSGGGYGTTVGAGINYLKTINPTEQLTSALTNEGETGLKYGEESTKVYANTGGGEKERLAAKDTATGRTATSAAKAGYLRAEVNLLGSKMRETIDSISGNPAADKWLRQHQPQLQQMAQNIQRIKANIAKLDPNGPEARELGMAPAAAPQAQQAPAPAQNNLPRISGDKDYAKLQRGQQYIAPDGTVRTKQ